MIVHDVLQRSESWFAVRLGKLCASRAADVTATLKSGAEPVGRRDLRTALVLERLTGHSQENGYQNADMIRGIEMEPVALAAYEARTGQLVEPIGFCAHDSLLAGASPDGMVNDWEGLVEVKCPKSATHLSYLRANDVPRDYLPQLWHQFWITGVEWIDFVSFDDRFPEPLRYWSIRLERRLWAKEIHQYSMLAKAFLDQVQQEYDAVQALMSAAV